MFLSKKNNKLHNDQTYNAEFAPVNCKFIINFKCKVFIVSS